MITAVKKKISDEDLQNDIISELKYEPSVTTSDIGVLVHDGVVTLNGYTSSYFEKANAVKAAKRVVGVNAIADDIQIRLSGSASHDDGDIAMDASRVLKHSPSVPAEVNLVVREGWITLEGQVEWWYQKNAAEEFVAYINGVKGVSNLITIHPKLSAAAIETDIKEAFERSAMLDADDVSIVTSGSHVTLNGEVKTYSEKEEAERTAWDASGVKTVDNNITVNWSWVGD